MRQPDKVIRQKQQHLVREPAAPFNPTVPPTDSGKKRPKLCPTHHELLERKSHPPWE